MEDMNETRVVIEKRGVLRIMYMPELPVVEIVIGNLVHQLYILTETKLPNQ